jgi:type VI protein secretion system component VasF
MNSTSLPTEVQMRQLREVQAALPRAVEAVNELVARFTPLLEELSRRGVYPQPPKPVGGA